MKGCMHKNDKCLVENFQAFPGIRLAVLGLPAGTSFSTDFQNRDQVFEFAYILDGRASVMLEEYCAAPIELEAGAAIVHHLPLMPGRFEALPGHCIQMIGLEVERDVLKKMLMEDEDACPILLNLLDEGHDPCFMKCMGLEAIQSAVIRQILSCPFSGLSRSLFFQSKVLELLSLQFEAMGRANRPIRCGVLTPDEEERIRYGREILKSRMENAPLLDELSRITGLSPSKLNRGFKIVFGKTAYTCLHEDRMARAHELLSRRHMNVSQVAWQVGYINVGHFSTAFRKHYGIRPKAFQMAGV